MVAAADDNDLGWFGMLRDCVEKSLCDLARQDTNVILIVDAEEMADYANVEIRYWILLCRIYIETSE
jgi:hypothetical protein